MADRLTKPNILWQLNRSTRYIKEYEPKWNFEKIISETLIDHKGVIKLTKERFGIK